MSAFDPLAPIEAAIRYGEQRAIREAEQREQPWLICQENGAHIRTWADPTCVICGAIA